MATTDNKTSGDANNEAGAADVENSYGLPPSMMNTIKLEAYGARVKGFPLDDPLGKIKELRALKIRDDDILIAAYPKCGTHWTWEITQMLINQTTVHETRTKAHLMLEFVTASTIDAQPSPRVLNSHYWMVHLPQEIIEKKTKIIHVVRNPKDAIVSYYHHLLQIPQHGGSFSFDSMLKAYMANAMSNTHQFDYLRMISEFQKSHPEHPIKLIYYEELKKDPVKTIKGLAEFLQIPATDAFCEEVALACNFDTMKVMDESREWPQDLKKLIGDHPKSILFRKGIIGDWKNHFTVAQNELFDEFIARETAKGLDFTFIYE